MHPRIANDGILMGMTREPRAERHDPHSGFNPRRPNGEDFGPPDGDGSRPTL